MKFKWETIGKTKHGYHQSTITIRVTSCLEYTCFLYGSNIRPPRHGWTVMWYHEEPDTLWLYINHTKNQDLVPGVKRMVEGVYRRTDLAAIAERERTSEYVGLSERSKDRIFSHVFGLEYAS